MKHLSALNKYLIRYKWHVIGGTIFIIISNLFAIIPAQVVRYAFDLVKESLDLYFVFEGFGVQNQIFEVFGASILLFGIVILVMALLKGIFLFFVRQTLIVMSRLVEYDMKNDIYAHYQTLPLSFYRKNNTGDLMARISEDVSRVRMYLGPAIMYGLNLVVMFVLVIGYMLSVNVKMTLFVLLPMPFLSLAIYFVNTIIEKRSDEIQKKLSGLSTFVQEAFSGIRVLKSYNREKNSVADFTEASNEYRQKVLRLTQVDSTFQPLMVGLVGLSTLMTVYVGGLEVMNGTISAGTIAEFIMYVSLLTWPVAALGWTTSLIQRASVSQQRINEFLNIPTDIVSEKNIQKDIAGKITFENVSFVYPDSGIVALQNLSFEIEAGQSLAILGTTGSGKSTVANLLCRMYDATSGNIMIDDTDIKAYNISSLRQQIGYVPQDVFLFSDTIADNIAFGSVQLSEEQLIKASKDADVYENIMGFSEGFKTMVGERGVTLSGGQKQRVSMARAIVREPAILILDDALSAVDTKTENTILNNLQLVMENRTSVIISHRVSSVKLADKILVLDDGKVVETGTHDSLLARNGFYKELYEKQIQLEEA
ncbi:MAG: ABC transporter ATP-binding protein [Verrucomicrobia bacterium]|nr:ABC transporter ATP-binding protein [Cytophagales bacterium]